MRSHYGERLLQFANSIDIVDEDTFKLVVSLIQEYVGKILDVKNISVFIDVPIGEKMGLLKKFSNKGPNTIKNDDGNYNGQTYYSYDLGKPLWIVSGSRSFLRAETDYIDQWSESTEIPPYFFDEYSEAKTSIIVPIKKEGHTYGVVNYESDCYLEITNDAKHELEIITDSISRLFKSSQFSRSLSENTSSAIDSLRSWLNENNIPKLTKPKIFLASSKKAEPDVINVILEELKKRSDIVDLIYWKDINDAGNISNQIFDAISSCRFAVCYLSEGNENDSEYKYQDNPNVVFEAGMFHGRTKYITREVSNWIPIREKESLPAPMDFSSERTIYPPRNKDGELNIERLRSEFIKRVEAVIGGG